MVGAGFLGWSVCDCLCAVFMGEAGLCDVVLQVTLAMLTSFCFQEAGSLFMSTRLDLQKTPSPSTSTLSHSSREGKATFRFHTNRGGHICCRSHTLSVLASLLLIFILNASLVAVKNTDQRPFSLVPLSRFHQITHSTTTTFSSSLETNEDAPPKVLQASQYMPVNEDIETPTANLLNNFATGTATFTPPHLFLIQPAPKAITDKGGQVLSRRVPKRAPYKQSQSH